MDVVGDGLKYAIDFTLEEFFGAVNGDDERVQVIKGSTVIRLIDYINTFYPEFFTANGSLFTGNEFFATNTGASAIAAIQLSVWGWNGGRD